MSDSFPSLAREVVACRKCPRLVEWRRASAEDPPARFRGQSYWARPLPAFGDPAARLLVVGLAPAAHGGNRTGRVFTGDASGDFLFRALWETGFANQPTSTAAGDGLALDAVIVTAAVRCAPPANRPTPGEFAACRPFLEREIALLAGLRVVVALGSLAFTAALSALKALGRDVPRPRPAFGHGREAVIGSREAVIGSREAVIGSREAVIGSREAVIGDLTLIGSYHPSQQNTFTGKLTRPMLAAIFARARQICSETPV